LVFFFEGSLMIPRVIIKKTYKVAADRGVYNLIYSGRLKGSFLYVLLRSV
jgi:hypothetical protein